MNDSNRKCNSHVDIHHLIDDAVNNALARRSEVLLPLSEKEAESISGGRGGRPILRSVSNNPNYPCTTPFPVVHGVIINPNPAD